MGFPIGHATPAAAFFGAVIYLAESVPAPTRTLVRIGAALVIVLVALARIVLRVHWPGARWDRPRPGPRLRRRGAGAQRQGGLGGPIRDPR